MKTDSLSFYQIPTPRMYLFNSVSELNQYVEFLTYLFSCNKKLARTEAYLNEELFYVVQTLFRPVVVVEGKLLGCVREQEFFRSGNNVVLYSTLASRLHTYRKELDYSQLLKLRV
jgi:hypothetical protein